MSPRRVRLVLSFGPQCLSGKSEAIFHHEGTQPTEYALRGYSEIYVF